MSKIDELIRNLGDTVRPDNELERKAADHAWRVLCAATTAETAGVRRRWLDRRVLAAIDAEGTHVRRQSGHSTMARTRGRTRAGRLLPLATLASVGAAVCIALLISQVLVGGGAGRPQAAAAAVLRRAADAALASPPARLGPGQYWYEENQGTYLDAAGTAHGVLNADVSQVSRYWIGAQHWQRQDRLVKVRALGPVTHPWQRSVLTQFGANPNITGTGASFDVPMTYDRMLRAPRGLQALARFVLSAEIAPGFKATGAIRDQALVTGIHDILIEPMVPARLQAGVFRLAATIPGIHIVGPTHDTLGRAAVTVGFVERLHHVRAEFLFDPVSYALLDYRVTALTSFGRYIPAGTVLEETAFIRAGLVHRAPSSCPNCLAVGPNP
jgi:hypothetical protein